ncbi:platelet binding protein GspB-like [Haliotis rufescens]|uniref:platelet binding protein GspB-like n=1 Tax=Haliotis rufescens TaxID=6454 RepID=UPI00201F9B00|nr:platelet binding protein GspB-like [Haliotis rufescens]
MADELGKIVRPQSPTRTCSINPSDKSHIGLILSESRVTEKSCEKLLSVRTNEIVCALSSKTIYLSNSGQVISNIDLPYYWCNFCTFKTEEKHQLLTHLMDHRFSCQYCVFQTFSRVDVVRHTVQEHSEFDGSDLKVCVLLPDLLKHGLNQSNDNSKKSPKEKSKLKSESEAEETESPNSKRKRTLSVSEEDTKVYKGEGQAKRGRTKSKRGRPRKAVSAPKSKLESERTVRSSSEDESKPTERLTRSSPKLVKKDRMPGVCFECSVCKFRTFKKAILGKHTELDHDAARPKFALKIVSLSQAQDIDASDEKNKSILKDTVPSSSKEKKKTEKEKEKTASVPDSEPCKKDTEDEEEEVNDAVVEMDYAEEDDEDEDEDAGVDEETNKGLVPDMKSTIETKHPVLGDHIKPAVIVNPSIYTCLLCSTIHDSTFSVVKNHYFDSHPGGTLVMGESTSVNSVVQWIYFCVTTDCFFHTTNPTSWLEHCRICQKEAYENPNLCNSLDASMKNTVNAVRENMLLMNQAQPGPVDAGTSVKGSAPLGYVPAVHIKTEPQLPPTVYVYESEAPTCGKQNEMLQDQQPPSQTLVQGSLISDSVSSSSSSSAQAVSSSEKIVPVVPPLNISQSKNAIVNMMMIRKMNSHLASSAVSSTSTANSNTSTSATTTTTTTTPATSSTLATRTSTTSANRNSSNSVPHNNRSPATSNTLAASLNRSTPPTNAVATPPTTRSPNPYNLPSGKTSWPSSPPNSPNKSVDSNVQFDVEKKGNYKCAHCRYLAAKALEVRTHMIDRHKMNPLYGLDMLAEECKVPRFMLFCPKDKCKFCTKGKDLFLKHLDECASVDNGGNFTDEYKKRLEVTRNFALSTLKKLQMLTQ